MERDPIFKGATRPAMMAGVPIVPFILVVGVHLMLAMWAIQLISFFVGFVILMTGVLSVFVLRHISSQDNQRLNQYLLRMKSTAGRRNHSHWHAHSVSPVDFQKRK